MDGVLVDSGAHHRQAWRVLLDELGVTPSQPDFWRLTIGRPSLEAVPLLLDRATPLAEARRPAERKQRHYRVLSPAGPAPRSRPAAAPASAARAPARWPPGPRVPPASRCWSGSACGTAST